MSFMKEGEDLQVGANLRQGVDEVARDVEGCEARHEL